LTAPFVSLRRLVGRRSARRDVSSSGTKINPETATTAKSCPDAANASTVRIGCAMRGSPLIAARNPATTLSSASPVA
jgi:hypothetical protein